MAAAKDLPIYRSAMRLVAHLVQATRKAPRDLRYTLVQRLLDEAFEVCVNIVEANRVSGADRAARVDVLIARIARLQAVLTVAIEQHCLSSRGAVAVAMEHADALGRQAYGWARHTVSEPAAAVRQSRTDLPDRAGVQR